MESSYTNSDAIFRWQKREMRHWRNNEYFGWDGTDDFDTAKVLFAAMGKLKRAGIDEELLMELKDLGMTFVP